jgi:hypothetical protein
VQGEAQRGFGGEVLLAIPSFETVEMQAEEIESERRRRAVHDVVGSVGQGR